MEKKRNVAGSPGFTKNRVQLTWGEHRDGFRPVRPTTHLQDYWNQLRPKLTRPERNGNLAEDPMSSCVCRHRVYELPPSSLQPCSSRTSCGQLTSVPAERYEQLLPPHALNGTKNVTKTALPLILTKLYTLDYGIVMVGALNPWS